MIKKGTGFIKSIVLRWMPPRVLIHAKTMHYARMLRRNAYEDERDLKVVRYLVNPGDYAIDVGANVGLYTKALSEFVQNDGQIFSIEPVEETYQILCSVVRKLGLLNVVPMKYALSDKEGFVAIEIPRYGSGGFNYYRAHIVGDDTSKSDSTITRVRSAMLDSLFLGMARRITFVKCDVEDHELACLRGATRFLESGRPAWLIEISGDPDQPQQPAWQLFKLMAERGYSAWWFDFSVLKRRRRGDASTNYFFLTNEHISCLSRRAPELLARTSSSI